MSSTLIRPFGRGDREQVTILVNAHIAAVVPGVSVSVQALMSQLEREPGEFIVDRWVRERVTLVAEQRGRVVAAAHLLRYGEDADTAENYRNAGEIRWLACWPDAPYWPDAAEAGDALAMACHAQFQRWGVTRSWTAWTWDTSRWTPTWISAPASPGWERGRTSATCGSSRPIAAGASARGWSARQPGGWSWVERNGFSTTPKRRKRTTRLFSPRLASPFSPAQHADSSISTAAAVRVETLERERGRDIHLLQCTKCRPPPP